MLLVFSHALSCVTHIYVWLSLVLSHIILLVSSLIAQPPLSPSNMPHFLLYSLALALCFEQPCGSYHSICTLHSKCNISKSCTNIGELLYFLQKHSFFQTIISFVHLVCRIFLIAFFSFGEDLRFCIPYY